MSISIDKGTLRFYEPRTTPLKLEDARHALAAERRVIETYGVFRRSICGSVARNEARPDSDLDLLVEMDLSTNPARRYFDLIAYLEDQFRRDIGLLVRDGVKPRVLPSITLDVVAIF